MSFGRGSTSFSTQPQSKPWEVGTSGFQMLRTVVFTPGILPLGDMCGRESWGTPGMEWGGPPTAQGAVEPQGQRRPAAGLRVREAGLRSGERGLGPISAQARAWGEALAQELPSAPAVGERSPARAGQSSTGSARCREPQARAVMGSWGWGLQGLQGGACVSAIGLGGPSWAAGPREGLAVELSAHG